jgi:hypothetical protein
MVLPSRVSSVFRLDVTMDHAMVVRVLKPLGCFPGDPERLVHG